MRRLPRWLVFGIVAGLLAFAALFGPWAQPSVQVKSIVDGLRSSSVYEAPGAPGIVNAERARQVIGDRAIVLILLDRTPLSTSGDDNARMSLCHAVSEVVSGDYVWVYGQDEKGRYEGDSCVGADFPTPKDGDLESFQLTLAVAAEQSAQYRRTDSDRTPEIEEFVLSFDTQAAEAYGEIPTRSAIPDTLAGKQLALACAGMVAGTVVLFFGLRWAGVTVRKRREGAAARRRQRVELDARMSRVADAVLHPAPPESPADAERQAEVARQYVLALDHFDRGEYRVVADELGRLEEALR